MGHPHVRSDQYCLAVSYIELRTGELPLFARRISSKSPSCTATASSIFRASVPARPKSSAGRQIPIRRALCHVPRMVRELRAAVELDLADKPPRRSAEPFDAANTRKGGGSQTAMGKREPVRRTSRLIFTAALVLIVGGLTAAAVWWDRWRKPVEKDETPPVIAGREEPKPPPVAEPTTKPENRPADSSREQKSSIVSIPRSQPSPNTR